MMPHAASLARHKQHMDAEQFAIAPDYYSCSPRFHGGWTFS